MLPKRGNKWRQKGVFFVLVLNRVQEQSSEAETGFELTCSLYRTSLRNKAPSLPHEGHGRMERGKTFYRVRVTNTKIIPELIRPPVTKKRRPRLCFWRYKASGQRQPGLYHTLINNQSLIKTLCTFQNFQKIDYLPDNTLRMELAKSRW